MKKRLPAALAAVLLLALAGCGGRESEEAAPAAAPAAQTAQAEPDTAEQAPQEDAQQDPEAEPAQTDAAAQPFAAMELEVRQGTLYIREGAEFSLARKDGKTAEYEIDSDTLVFVDDHTGDTVLTLPEGGSYGLLALKVKDGHVYGEAPLALDELDLTMEHGEASLEAVTVRGRCRIDVEEGSAYVKGDVGPEAEALCSQGHLGLEVPFAKEDCNYTLEVSEGELRLGGEGYHGRAGSSTVDNGADRSMALTCRRGELSVEFER